MRNVGLGRCVKAGARRYLNLRQVLMEITCVVRHFYLLNL